jgi:CubicO group peptidase (beta-lactamase class C family)
LFASSPEDFVERLRRLPLASSPSEKWRYSVSTDVLGIVIERVTGMSLADFLQQEIFLPLDMQDTSFVVPADKVPRFTTMYTKKIFGTSLKVKEQREESSYLHTPPVYMGGAGLVSTVDDYYKFCSMLLEDGYYPTANGPQQLLQTETIEAMLHNQLPDGIKIKEEYGFGYGVIVKTEKPGHTHEGEVNWDGIGSTHFWMLPEQDVVVIALSQYQPFSRRLFQGLHTILYDLPMTQVRDNSLAIPYQESTPDEGIEERDNNELPSQQMDSE